MRHRTLAVVAIFLLAVGAIAVFGLVAEQHSSVSLTATWVSDTERAVAGNHHAPAAGRWNGTPVVFAPISGRANTENCALVSLAGDGSVRWRHRIPAPNCTIHSVADPTFADFDSDGVPEVVAATTEQTVAAYHPGTGATEFSHNLTSYGYTRPIVADFGGDSRPEIVVVDVKGTVFVVGSNGTVRWRKQLSSYTWGQPAVADFDGDGRQELAVSVGASGNVSLFEEDGSSTWDSSGSLPSSITWMTTGQLDDDRAIEIVVATAQGGRVAAIDGATGEREWTKDFGTFAAVHAIGDGDDDGLTEAYVVAQDGILRSLDGPTGAVEWTTTLTSGSVQMMPPPALGDVTGDGAPELIAVTNDGIVSVVDPHTGNVLGSYERDVPIFTHPELADTDDDGAQEIYVMYAQGRVVAIEAAS
jgi:outer membrane protein assembly factor BamB